MTNKYQISDIETLINENTLIIFTQNSYPVEHPMKFLHIAANNPTNNPDDYDVKVPTDINITSNCNNKYINNLKFNLNNKEIQFANLSKAYFKKYGKVIDVLNISEKSYLGTTSFPNTIGSKCKHPYTCAAEPIEYDVNGKVKYFIKLFKGQICKLTSHSAFNYHSKIIKRLNGVDTEMEVYKKLIPDPARYIEEETDPTVNTSTGLWEFILASIKNMKEDINELEITVCGTNAFDSVAHTVLQGIHTWKTFYAKDNEEKIKNVNFIYSLFGTLYTDKGLYKEPTNFKNWYVPINFTNDDKKVFFEYFNRLQPNKSADKLPFKVNYKTETLFIYPDDKDKNMDELLKTVIDLNIKEYKYIKMVGKTKEELKDATEQQNNEQDKNKLYKVYKKKSEEILTDISQYKYIKYKTKYLELM